MKILLINPVYPDRPRGTYFPLGLAYISAILKQSGHSIEAIDTDASLDLTEGKLRRKLLNSKFDIVGIGGLITASGHIRWLTFLVRELRSNIPIVLGGGFSSSLPKFSLESTAGDIAVVGEGEKTVVELVAALEKDEPFSSVKGIYYRDGEKIQKTVDREPIMEIDNIPFPDWDVFPIEVYLKNMWCRTETKSPQPTMVAISSRSCPFKCKFCYNPFGRRVRARSAENVIKELKILKKKYDIKVIHFLDDLFTISKDRVFDFCRQLEKTDLNIKWQCSSRTNVADLSMYRQMKKSGCTTVQFGIESGSNKILNIMNKNATTNMNKEAVRIVRAAGIEPSTNWMIGTFGESPSTIQASLNFIKEMNLFVPKFFFTTPYPDSNFFRRALKEGHIPNLKKFVYSLGNASDFCINLTNMSNRKLKSLKLKIEKEALRFYCGKNPAQIINVHKYEDGSLDLKFRCMFTQCQNEFLWHFKRTEIEEIIRCPHCTKKYYLSWMKWIEFVGSIFVMQHLLKKGLDALKSKLVSLLPYYKKLRRARYWMSRKEFLKIFWKIFSIHILIRKYK